MRSFIHGFRLMQRRVRAGLILGLTVLLLSISVYPVVAQQSPGTGNQVDGYPVVLDGNVLFRIKQGISGVVSAEERAKVINERLSQLASDAEIPIESIHIVEAENASVVMAGNTVLFTIRPEDQEGGKSHQSIAQQLVTTIKPEIAQYRQNRSIEQIVRGILFAVLSTVALIVLGVLLQRFFDRLLAKIRVARRADKLNLRMQNLQLLGSDATGYLLAGLIRVLRLVLIFGGLYLYIPFVLSQFPATKAIGKSILSDIAFRINQIVTAFVQYLPNLAVIVIIAVLTHYVIQFAKLVITELGRDDAYPWFYPEWIQPTARLANLLLIAIACIIAAPYLPGFNSPAFQGVSLFLGALFTLGSSSAIANAIAGVILIYTRAFQIGDIIQIGETIGEVLEKTLFVTRVLTFKKEVITIPNASVLNSNVVNFNAISREFNSYLVLHTTITLGYDVPWRKVHEVLIQAAKATPGIIDKPQPFVLQTGLNDFHVSYELNAYSAYPQLMPKIYSELHQHIQDYCNQAGIEILSPAYSAIRDGNHSTIPSNYLPSDYTPPSFQIHSPNSHKK